MKYLKPISTFLNNQKIKLKLIKYGVKNYTINSDGTIDVDGDVDLSENEDISKTGLIPFNFGVVSGNFNCSGNNLISLEGSPIEVGGFFYCYNNKLKNLIGSPKLVSEEFNCNYNRLETLEGMPAEIVGDFGCIGNDKLKEIDSVSNIEGFIYCDKSADTSLFLGYCKGFKHNYFNI